MSVASSIPCIKIPNPSFCSSPSSSSSSSSSSSNSYSYSFYRYSKPKPLALFSTTISCSEGPIRRPAAPPPLRDQPSSPSPPNPPVVKPAPPSPPSASVAQSPQPKLATMGDGRNLITLEFQRQKAKELQEYFKQKKIEEANEGPFFGFIGKNEISNGRWAMFGFAVGMLTEYATGSDLVDQVKILLSNFGIVDLD